MSVHDRRLPKLSRQQFQVFRARWILAKERDLFRELGLDERFWTSVRTMAELAFEHELRQCPTFVEETIRARSTTAGSTADSREVAHGPSTQTEPVSKGPPSDLQEEVLRTFSEASSAGRRASRRPDHPTFRGRGPRSRDPLSPDRRVPGNFERGKKR